MNKAVCALAALALIPALTGCGDKAADATPTVTVTPTSTPTSSPASASSAIRHCAESTAIIDGPGDGDGADLTMVTLDVSDSGTNLIAAWELDSMPPSAQRLALSVSLASMDGSQAGQIGAHVQGGKVTDVFMLRPSGDNSAIDGPTEINGSTVTVTVPLGDVTSDYGSKFVWSAAASVDGGSDDVAPDNALDLDHPACNTFTVSEES
jgi:predicted small lipoprotein YifL